MKKILVKSGLIALAVAVSACTDPGRFGAGGAGGDGTVGADTYAAGGASNPNSPEYFSQRVGDRVLFAVDQSTLSPEAQQTLTAQAQWLNTNSSYSAIVEGHADEQGTREYNLALGARRANAVQEYLVSQGVAGARLKTVSYGKERPLEVCSTEVCYSKNRRSVTVLSAGAGF
ncbi:MAG: peptidoglycan-associated lipoprotein Pal [Vannielia sp.]|uniref:peptidoglycan-associated lipoprotein Pal n=1 Tax=Rhodobacterales TaxID=204455 RepID=UPI002095D9C8|nr:peptidoglycan-associated lipoprotein Pal [Oceanicola sp. 502str15]MCO6383142.1 peptidoglycan-associated lipoprotein Pal [Oceanicola sp. 502str15]